MKVYLSGIQLQPLTFGEFPGGEWNIKVPENTHGVRGQNCTIEVQMTQPEDIMALILLKDAIEREYQPKYFTLDMMYVPYARQDRVCNKGEAHSSKVFCNLINSMKFDKVLIADPHSDVVTALLDNVVVMEQHDIWKGRIPIKLDSVLLIPDAGAAKKSMKVAQALGFDEVYQAEKIRNIRTGKIENIIVHAASSQLSGKVCYIFDDICDGGFTFIGLAEKLKSRGVSEVILCVTHGIFSKGVDELLTNGINEIYTTDSIGEWESAGKLTVINL